MTSPDPAPASPAACPFDTNDDGDCGRPLCPYCGKYPASPAAGEWHYSQDANGDWEIWEQIDARKFRLVARCKGETMAKLLANIPARLTALERERDDLRALLRKSVAEMVRLGAEDNNDVAGPNEIVESVRAALSK